MIGILEILSSSAIGTALGGLFSFLTKIEERKTLAVRNAHEIALGQQKIDAAKLQVDSEISQAELKVLEKSQDTGNQHTGVKWVDATSSLMRPLITLALFCMTCWIALTISNRVNTVEGIGPDELISLWRHLVLETVFLTSTAISWWFGSRPSSARKR